jgi:asparagine synthase (glutamine-hydrolysing)
VGLGQVRLAILDLSDAGKCPMRYEAPSGRIYWITFNGEVFNFLELRSELSALGYRFNSDTDTEVCAAAFDKWGEAFLDRCNGMWAIAIWDESAQELFIARDRFGVKPLYYHAGRRFAFASELKAFLALGDFTSQLNEEIVGPLFERARYDGVTDSTALKGVKSLLGGHSVRVKADGSYVVRRWWETSQHLVAVPPRYEDQVETFRELLLDATRLRMRSDVPVGTCLSGGVDSSAVAGCMHHLHTQPSKSLERTAGDWQRAFIATFPGSPIDERVHAETMLQALGAKPTFLEFNSDEALRNLVDCIWSLDEPTGGYAVQVWLLYREMRRNKVVVSLDGHGGDELLAGYAWYLDYQWGKLNQHLYEEYHSKVLPTILRNFDRCSAAHGVEVRMPLMDYRLVQFAFSLDASAKLGGGVTKRILRDAIRGIVPESIRLRRQKIGFNAPMIEWFNGGLLPLIEKVVSHRVWKQSPFFNGPVLGQQILERCRARGWTASDWDTTYKVSTLLNFSIWQMLYTERCAEDLL